MRERISAKLSSLLKNIDISLTPDDLEAVILSTMKACGVIAFSFLTWSVFTDKGDSPLLFQLNVLCIVMLLSRLTRTEFYRNLGTNIMWLFSGILVLAAIVLLGDAFFSLLRFSPGFLRAMISLLVLLAFGTALIHASRKEKSIFKAEYWQNAEGIFSPWLAVLLPNLGLFMLLGIASSFEVSGSITFLAIALYFAFLTVLLLRDKRKPLLAFLPAKVSKTFAICLGSITLWVLIA